MSQDPKSQAREVALAHGSAAQALNVLGPIYGADEGELRHQPLLRVPERQDEACDEHLHPINPV